ncbi:MAG: hypothetical protein M3362_08580 [Acidobacteriota bacterium]|nr:hypothetical protein [Acidobacteriota bacterium]
MSQAVTIRRNNRTPHAEQSEEVGEQPLDDEIYSLLRSGQNRAHSLSLELKRMHRVLDRVKLQAKRILSLETELTESKTTIERQDEELKKLKAWKRERELEDMRRS